MKEHTFEGYRVIEISRRSVAGGIAVDVQKHPDEKRWPWTVTQFTTALVNLK